MAIAQLKVQLSYISICQYIKIRSTSVHLISAQLLKNL